MRTLPRGILASLTLTVAATLACGGSASQLVHPTTTPIRPGIVATEPSLISPAGTDPILPAAELASIRHLECSRDAVVDTADAPPCDAGEGLDPPVLLQVPPVP